VLRAKSRLLSLSARPSVPALRLPLSQPPLRPLRPSQIHAVGPSPQWQGLVPLDRVAAAPPSRPPARRATPIMQATMMLPSSAEPAQTLSRLGMPPQTFLLQRPPQRPGLLLPSDRPTTISRHCNRAVCRAAPVRCDIGPAEATPVSDLLDSSFYCPDQSHDPNPSLHSLAFLKNSRHACPRSQVMLDKGKTRAYQ
jgi:hypothetical protein